MYREPASTQYPVIVPTTRGVCTVLRHRQIYQHVQLKLIWEDGTVNFVWFSFGDNCEDGFEVGEHDGVPRARYLAKEWISNYHNL